MKIHPFSFLIFAFVFGKTQAQDIHFSMYQNVPTLLNPALVGLAPGENTQRITCSYRSQWLKPVNQPAFHTALASYDFRWCPLPCDPGEVKFFGFGLNMAHDRSGASPLQRSQALFQFSFSQSVGNDLLLAAGAEGGAIFRQLGNGERTFDEQFIGGVYDETAQGEDFDQIGFAVEDFGAGAALYTSGNGSEGHGFSVGASFKHLTQPEYRFFQDSQPEIKSSLPMRMSLHGRFHWLIRRNSHAADIRALFMDQGVYRQFLVGLDGLWYLQSRQSHLFNMDGGLAWRRAQFLDSGWHSDALVFALALNTDAVRFSLSYDLSLSKVQVLQNRGAFELSFQYFWKTGDDCRMIGPAGI